MSERKDILNLWLNNLDGVGNKAIKFFRDNFDSVEEIYACTENDIKKINEKYKENEKCINRVNTEQIIINKNLDKAKRIYERLKKLNISIIYPGHCDFPDKLMHIYDTPQILYIKGKLKPSINDFDKNIAIVGSRKADLYGREMTELFSRGLSGNGINIISGLAYGIDGIAHRSALDAGGYTLGVLGCGINVVYPRANIELYARMEETGCIISEYGLDVSPCAGLFPLRNRIISGLSDGVLVVQAQKKSGSLITADYALEQGKQVYAIPGRLYDASSEGSNNLIKLGAVPVTSVEDIIDDLNGEINISCINDNKKIMENESFLDNLEMDIYNSMSLEPVYIEEIINKFKISTSRAINILFKLENLGLIKQPLKGYYIKRLY